MTSDDRYSVISVGSNNDDEIVIQAGIQQAINREKVAESNLPFGAVIVSDTVESISPRGENDLAAKKKDNQISSEEGARFSASRELDYQETSKEDLDSIKPMSILQKGIIVMAVVVLVAFLLYYNFLR